MTFAELTEQERDDLCGCDWQRCYLNCFCIAMSVSEFCYIEVEGNRDSGFYELEDDDWGDDYYDDDDYDEDQDDGW